MSATDKAKAKRPPTFDHLKKKQPVTRRVAVYLSDDAVTAHASAQSEYERARLLAQGLSSSMGEDAAKDLTSFVDDAVRPEREAYEKAVAALEAETVWLTFKALGTKRYDEIVRACPATDAQNKEHRELTGADAPYDIDAFAPALLSASCVEPSMSVEQWRELLDEWNTAEVVAVFSAAIEVNTQPRDPHLGKAYG